MPWSGVRRGCAPRVSRQVSGVLVLLALVAGACSSGSSGSVTGVLVEEGGPNPNNHTPVAGTVELKSSSGTYSAAAGSNGRFTVSAPPGVYDLQGRPENWTAGGYPCGGLQVTVTGGGSAKGASVTCTFP